MVQIIDKSDFNSLEGLNIQSLDLIVCRNEIPKINFKKVKFKNFQNLTTLEKAIVHITPLDIIRNVSIYNADDSLVESTPLRRIVNEVVIINEQADRALDHDESSFNIQNETIINIPVTSILNEDVANDLLLTWPPKKTKTKKTSKALLARDVGSMAKKKSKRKISKVKPYFISGENVIAIQESEIENLYGNATNEDKKTNSLSQAFPWSSSTDGYEELEGIFSGGLESQLVDTEDVYIDNLTISKEKLEEQEEEIDSIFSKQMHEEINEEMSSDDKKSQVLNSQPLVIRAIMPNMPPLKPNNQ